MSRESLPCVVCEKALINVDADGGTNQPSGGTEFTTIGHYGSTIIDYIEEPQDDPLTFVVNICDTCVLRALDAGVIQSRSKEIHLSRHPVDDRQRAWVLAQNYKHYGAVWGEDEVVDYEALMLQANEGAEAAAAVGKPGAGGIGYQDLKDKIVDAEGRQVKVVRGRSHFVEDG